MDTKATLFENLLMHEYTECYLYYSMLNDESDGHIKSLYEMMLDYEIAHLHLAADMLKEYEGKDYTEIVGTGEFPELIKLHENKDYVRKVLAETVTLTGNEEGYENVNFLPDDARFFNYQNKTNACPDEERAHTVIERYIEKNGKDYRFEEKPSPIEALRSRTSDNYTLGRVKRADM
jgi:hypothetical protein